MMVKTCQEGSCVRKRNAQTINSRPKRAMQQVMNLGQVFRRQRHIRDRRDRFPNDVSVRAAPHQRVEHRARSTEPPKNKNKIKGPSYNFSA